MDDENRIEQQCLEKGLRMTAQRRVIALALSRSSDHPDIITLHQRSMEIDPKISLATVYRTMRLLEEAGVVERHDFDGSRSRYEEASESHHDHLIDLSSGDVIEFINDEIEALQQRIAAEHGYRLLSHKLELYGVPLNADRT